MNTKWLLTGLLMLIIPACMPGEQAKIKESVIRHQESYPSSTLQDLYKFYFQDYFGPGHMISNPDAAGKYLEYELEQNDYIDTVMLFPTGYKGNFLRVNLQLIKDGTLPKSVFMQHFIQSANAVTGISMEDWREEWGRILSVIREVSPGLPGFEADRQRIDSLLEEGEYVVHHSTLFLETYHPHYRIIQRDVFEENFSDYLLD